MKRLAISCVCVGCALVLAACGGSSSKATAPSATEPPTTTAPPTTVASAPKSHDSCALVPLAQAEALIGTTLEAGVHEATSDVDSCTYSGDPNGPTAQVEVFIGPGAKHFYDDDNTVLQHTFTTVPGLGNEAHEEDYALFFRKGDTWVALRLTSLDDFSMFKARMEAAARQLATQL